MFGTAVIVAVTARNVHDTCKTLKELNELNVELDLQPYLENDSQKICGVTVPTKEQIWTDIQENWIIAYEKARTAINQKADEMPDMPEMPELSSRVKRSWSMFQERLNRFKDTDP